WTWIFMNLLWPRCSRQDAATSDTLRTWLRIERQGRCHDSLHHGRGRHYFSI
ncbi:hypothetical protein COCMIDRAFT_104694, partial [Bipolaris oryzae ATCC 44560]